MGEHVDLITHENGIYELVFKDTSRDAVEEYFTIVGQLVRENPQGQDLQLRAIINMAQSGVPPFTQMTRKARTFMQEIKEMRGRVHLKGVLLTKSSTSQPILSLVNTFVQLMPIDIEMKAFSVSEREQAIEWLQN